MLTFLASFLASLTGVKLVPALLVGLALCLVFWRGWSRYVSALLFMAGYCSFLIAIYVPSERNIDVALGLVGAAVIGGLFHWQMEKIGPKSSSTSSRPSAMSH